MKKLGNVFILGDSYSTFEGYIPQGYAPYYRNAGNDGSDINRVDQTWWYQLLGETESNLVRNSSWSGSVVCYTGYDGRYCDDNCFVVRFDRLVNEGYFKQNKIDTFFLFGGTNDSWANSPLGEIKWQDWTKEDMNNALPAICYLMDAISKNVSGAKLYCILNDELKPEISDCFKLACKKYNAKYIQLHDIDKQSGHPTIKGMKQIEKQVYECV